MEEGNKKLSAEEVVKMFQEAGAMVLEGQQATADLRQATLPDDFPQDKRAKALLLLGQLADVIDKVTLIFEEMSVLLTKPSEGT